MFSPGMVTGVLEYVHNFIKAAALYISSNRFLQEFATAMYCNCVTKFVQFNSAYLTLLL